MFPFTDGEADIQLGWLWAGMWNWLTFSNSQSLSLPRSVFLDFHFIVLRELSTILTDQTNISTEIPLSLLRIKNNHRHVMDLAKESTCFFIRDFPRLDSESVLSRRDGEASQIQTPRRITEVLAGTQPFSSPECEATRQGGVRQIGDRNRQEPVWWDL